MRYAVMSDVHANPAAMRTALDDARAQGAEKIVCLGDVVGYGPDPAEAVDICRSECDAVIMGNHDAAVAGVMGIDYFIPAAQLGVRRHSAELNETDRDWLKSLPYLHRNRSFLGAHGTPMRPDCFFYIHDMGMPTYSFATMVEARRRVLFIGHTHHALYIVQRPGSPLKAFDATAGFDVEPGLRYIVNVGAVGYPRADGDITYVIYDTSAKRIEFRHLPFDYKGYIDRMAAKGIPLPGWLQDRIDAWKANGVPIPNGTIPTHKGQDK